MGNYSIGIKDNTIFPETADQDVKDAFGLAVTIVLSSKNKEETIAFLEFIGLPFKK
jgi:large subunit ribosomal protein L5